VTPQLAVCIALGLVAGAAAAEPAPRVQIAICDSHHHVLRYWLRAAARGDVPAQALTVVHFDAHPDLGVPQPEPPRAWRERPEAVVAATDIERFQLTAAWLGVVGRVVWLRPTWAHQLPDGERRFRLGRSAGGALRVDDSSDYYVLENVFSPTAELRDAVEVSLRVLQLGPDLGARLAGEDAAILDIDLDGFATRNPAADALRAAGMSDAALAGLRAIFAPEKLALGATPEARAAGLERLLAAVRDVAEGGVLARLAGLFRLWRLGFGLGDLWSLWRIVGELPAGLPVSELLEHGRTLVGLPERAPVAAEIDATADALAGLLQSGALRPRLVTISRSARDGYTPMSAWPAIEWRLLRALHAALGDATVTYDVGLAPAPLR
jgi:hypothetical protein